MKDVCCILKERYKTSRINNSPKWECLQYLADEIKDSMVMKWGEEITSNINEQKFHVTNYCILQSLSLTSLQKLIK
jgi:hypothetical protein